MALMQKSYPIEIILSLTTGFLLKEGGFSEMHGLVEHVLGHPVWTHEFADKALWERTRELVFAQHPQLRDAEAFDRAAAKRDVATYLTSYVSRAVARYGATLEIQQGATEREENPIESAERILREVRGN
jgi:uncharacterized Zn finger protein